MKGENLSNSKPEYQCSCPSCVDERKAEEAKKTIYLENIWFEDDYVITA